MARFHLPMTKGDNHLSLSKLIAFALPQWPLAAIGLPVAVFLPPFYAGELGLGVQAVGVVFLIAQLIYLFSNCSIRCNNASIISCCASICACCSCMAFMVYIGRWLRLRSKYSVPSIFTVPTISGKTSFISCAIKPLCTLASDVVSLYNFKGYWQ